MREIQFEEIGNDYVAKLKYGIVIISPIHSRPELYSVRLESFAGEILAQEIFDYETCKVWARINLPVFDQATGEFSECGDVEETLAMCQQVLSIDTDAHHWMRIEHIKAWMADYIKEPYTIKDIPLSKHAADPLEWVDDGNIFYADNRHGRAVIQETRLKGIIGGGIRHKAKIVHSSGAKMDCYEWIDFMDAEIAIRRGLEELDDPTIDEGQLNAMEFTVEVCKALFPVETDPIHYARLDALATRIFLVLD